MAIIIGTLLTVLSILVVVYPFFRTRWPGLDDTGAAGGAYGNAPDTLDLDAIYDSIRTLQLEHQLGNIPEGLYQEQLRGYRLQAAAALRDQAALEARDEDWTLEEEVRVARAGLHRLNGATARCPNCGTPVVAGADQCGECNVSLSPNQSGPPEEASP
jgi:hypothetical protein